MHLTHVNYKNRGKRFETMLDNTNRTYALQKRAHFRKTFPEVKLLLGPKGQVRKHWFERSGGLDYIGLYEKRFISFDAKSTQNKTSFPLQNVEPHQFDELRRVQDYGGISFLLIHFEEHNETYYLSADNALDWANQTERKSIPYEWFKNHTPRVLQGRHVLLDYLAIVALRIEQEQMFETREMTGRVE